MSFQDRETSKPQSAKAAKRKIKRAAQTEKVIKASGVPQPLTAQTPRQKELLRALNERPVVFTLGPAGTGKTFISVRHALNKFLDRTYGGLVFTRATMAPDRHKLGFQPGNAKQKMAPWMVPIVDALKKGTSAANIERWQNDGSIEVAPFEFMRGRTFENVVVVLDEAQNCNYADLKLLITRMGKNSLLIINGDIEQTDIRDSGLETVAAMVAKFGLNAKIVEFTDDDVVRSEVAKEWVKAFKHHEKGTRPEIVVEADEMDETHASPEQVLIQLPAFIVAPQCQPA